MWTEFNDMHSGGGQKEEYSLIFIEADEETAKIIFYNRFGHNPERVTCTCCGEDYSISEHKDLRQATAYERGCDYSKGKYIEKKSSRGYSKEFLPFKKFMEKTTELTDGTYICSYNEESRLGFSGLFIPKEAIKKEEKIGDVPESGYIWVD